MVFEERFGRGCSADVRIEGREEVLCNVRLFRNGNGCSVGGWEGNICREDTLPVDRTGTVVGGRGKLANGEDGLKVGDDKLMTGMVEFAGNCGDVGVEFNDCVGR